MARRPLVLSIAAISLLLATRVVSAQSAEAEALFSDGDTLIKQGKLAEACDAFEASNRIEPRAGTLIRLGECREQSRQLASAWSAYKDALARVKDPKKKAIATAKIKELEPRLSYLKVSVPDEARIDGLVLMRNGQPLDLALWNRAIPVNGGDVTIAAHAPGRQEWKTTVQVEPEKAKVTVDVPKLEEPGAGVPDPTPIVQPAQPRPPLDLPSEDSDRSRWTGKRKAAVVLAAGATAGLVIGIVLGRQAKSKQDEAYALCPDPSVGCPDADRANALLDTADARALGANICFGVAGAVAIGAGVLWLTGAPKHDASIAIVPGARSFSVVGRF